MVNEWLITPAEDFCTSVRDGTHDSPKQVGEGRHLVTSRHIVGGRLDLSHAYLISDSDFEAINRRSKVDQWDVLVSMIGTVGEACLIRDEPNFAIKNVGLFKSRGETEGKWLYYYLQSPQARQQIKEQSRGTTQQYIPLGALREFPVLTPASHAEMRAIVHILAGLDDKIELNRRMNETLEGMARALFKSWFVDFDPARAKAEGRDPSLPKPISNLFPDSFQDSRLGKIPHGWKAGVVGDLGEVVCGKTPPTSDEENYGIDIPFVTIPDMHGKVFVTGTSKSLSIKGAATQSNKTLPPNTVCVSCIATVGLVALTSERCQTNQQINSVVPGDHASTLYCYFAIRERSKEIQSRGSGGSVLLNLNKSQFSALPILIPSTETSAEYQRLAKPMFDKILLNDHENQKLALLRDTLLPKLVSGELRLPDAERIVGGQV